MGGSRGKARPLRKQNLQLQKEKEGRSPDLHTKKGWPPSGPCVIETTWKVCCTPESASRVFA